MYSSGVDSVRPYFPSKPKKTHFKLAQRCFKLKGEVFEERKLQDTMPEDLGGRGPGPINSLFRQGLGVPTRVGINSRQGNLYFQVKPREKDCMRLHGSGGFPKIIAEGGSLRHQTIHGTINPGLHAFFTPHLYIYIYIHMYTYIYVYICVCVIRTDLFRARLPLLDFWLNLLQLESMPVRSGRLEARALDLPIPRLAELGHVAPQQLLHLRPRSDSAQGHKSWRENQKKDRANKKTERVTSDFTLVRKNATKQPGRE